MVALATELPWTRWSKTRATASNRSSVSPACLALRGSSSPHANVCRRTLRFARPPRSSVTRRRSRRRRLSGRDRGGNVRAMLNTDALGMQNLE